MDANSNSPVRGESRRRQRCPSCGAVLATNREQLENVCSRFKCRGPVLQRKSAEARERDLQQRMVVVQQSLQQLRDEFPSHVDGADSAIVMVVPNLEAEVVPLSDERRDRFQTHLKETMAQAVSMIADSSKANHGSIIDH